MRIVFDELRYKNLLGSGDRFTTINLNTDQSVLIVGKNGAGKSTWLDALCYVLFGKPFRKVNLGQLVNSVNGKGLLTELDFTINEKKYMIRRGMKKNIFEVYVDGELIKQNASVKEYQAILEADILKLDYQSFKQIVVMGSASFVPFMQLLAAARRELIENLLDITVFSDMNTILKGKKKDLKEKIITTKHNIEIAKVKYESLLAKQKAITTSIDEQRTAVEGELGINLSELVALTEKKNVLSSRIENVSYSVAKEKEVAANVRKMENIASKIDINLTIQQDKVKFYKTNDECDRCGQEIAEEHKTKSIDNLSSRVDEMATGYKELHEIIDKTRIELDRISKDVQTHRSLTGDLRSANEQIGRTNISIHACEEKIKSLVKPEHTEKIDEEIDALKNDIVTDVAEGRSQAKKMAHYDVISEYLSDKGVKTKIVGYYLPMINNTVNKFMEAMNFPVSFVFDENFNETLKSRYRDEFSYHSFSEGEKARINLAILFMMREVAIKKNRNSTNLMVFDEILDSSLDAHGIGDFLEILNINCKDTNVFIISHREDTQGLEYSKVLQFKKRGNFSVCEEK